MSNVLIELTDAIVEEQEQPLATFLFRYLAVRSIREFQL